MMQRSLLHHLPKNNWMPDSPGMLPGSFQAGRT